MLTNLWITPVEIASVHNLVNNYAFRVSNLPLAGAKIIRVDNLRAIH